MFNCTQEDNGVTCDYTTKRQWNLTRHEKKAHGIEPESPKAKPKPKVKKVAKYESDSSSSEEEMEFNVDDYINGRLRNQMKEPQQSKKEKSGSSWLPMAGGFVAGYTLCRLSGLLSISSIKSAFDNRNFFLEEQKKKFANIQQALQQQKEVESQNLPVTLNSPSSQPSDILPCSSHVVCS